MIGFSYVDHEMSRYLVEEYADHYRVKLYGQIDAVVPKDGGVIKSQGARLYKVRIRKVVDEYKVIKRVVHGV